MFWHAIKLRSSVYTRKICSLIAITKLYVTILKRILLPLIWKLLECLFSPVIHS